MSYPAPPPAPPRSNGLGIAAFILALVGIPVVCMAPIALLLSFIALFRRPRGFAFAGFVISLVMTTLVIGLISLIGWGMIAGARFGAPFFATLPALERAHQTINSSALNNGGVAPDDLSGTLLIDSIKDGWGHAFRYTRVSANTFELRSASRDGIFDTDDDLSERYMVGRGSP